MQILINFLGGRSLCFSSEQTKSLTGKDVKEFIQTSEGIPIDLQRLIQGTHELSNSETLVSDSLLVLRCSLRLLGGKGGFGALLRGSGAHSKSGAKLGGFDDCRDLNGRRIRNVKNERKLAEWYAQQKQKELEKLQKKQEEAEKISLEENALHLEHLAWNETREEIEETIASSVEKGLMQSLKSKKKKSKILKKEEKEEEISLKEEGGLSSWGEEKVSETKGNSSNSLPEVITSSTKEKEEMKVIPIPNKEEISNIRSIDLENFSSVDELKPLGLEVLKKELQSLGLLCGGTLDERANRLWQTKGKDLSEIEEDH